VRKLLPQDCSIDQQIKTSGRALPEVSEVLILKMLSFASFVKMDHRGQYRERSRYSRFEQRQQQFTARLPFERQMIEISSYAGRTLRDRVS
jgi:hypothetical protein